MMNRTFRHLSLAGVLLPLGLLAAAPADAQFGDLLKKGQDFLDDRSGGSSGAAAALSASDIASGLKEALRVGAERVVSQVGKVDGYNADPAIHLPLPESLQSVQSALNAAGMSGMLDDLELKLNRAAEKAAPKARALFVDAISEMSIDDAREIYNGPNDAATRYFQAKMSTPLAAEMTPIVDESLADVGAVKSYDAVMGQYKSIPFMPDAKTDLTNYAVEKGMAGIFHYLGQEEAAIRENPAKRTSELLQKVFGAK